MIWRSKEHNRAFRIAAGQVRAFMKDHPNWREMDDHVVVNSIAKRVAGEMMVYEPAGELGAEARGKR